MTKSNTAHLGVAPGSILRIAGLVLCLMMPATTTWAQAHVRTFSKMYSFDPDGVIDLSAYKGSIAIVPWDQAQVQIDVRIVAEDMAGAMMLWDVKVRIFGSLLDLTIETDYRKALKKIEDLAEASVYPRLPRVHYVIKMPSTARLKVEDYMSDTTINGFHASLEYYTYKGTLEVTNFRGAMAFDTFMGKARVALGAHVGDCSLQTHQGIVDVELPDGLGLNFDISLGTPQAVFADEGEVVELRPQKRTRPANGGAKPDQAYQATLNGGGALLTLATHSGALRLRKQ